MRVKAEQNKDTVGIKMVKKKSGLKWFGFLLCVWTSFQVLAAPESWPNYFFQPFSTFFDDFKTCSVISHLKSTKNVQKRKKTYFYLLLKAG